MDGDEFSQNRAVDDDLSLAVRALGDTQAFATLYRRYVEVVFRYCYRRLGDRAAAEDATQLIFEKALIALPRLAPQSTFRAWLFTIAHNTVIDMTRSRSRSLVLDIDNLTLFDPKPSPEDATIDRDQRDHLVELIRQLPNREQRLIDLRISGLNDKEIAVVMGMSHGAVRTSQYRALQRLRALMQSDQDRILNHVLA